MRRQWLDELRRDISAALRNMVRFPVTSGVAVISLAAGIGTTAATLTLRNGVFFNPPPLYRNPAELSLAGVVTPEWQRRQPVPIEVYTGWSRLTGVYSGISAAAAPRNTDVHTRDITTSIMVRPVTPGLFELLGVAPELGRTLSSMRLKTEQDSPVVLSYQAWQRLYAGRPDAVGTILWIEDRPHTVIGVMPRRFWFTHMDPTVWTALNVPAARTGEQLEVVVRRKPGVSPDALGDAFRSCVDQYAATLPVNERAVRLQIVGIAGTPISHDIGPFVVWLLEACVLLTLVISCTNVAVLVIAQWTGREREIALHAALGAGRARILRSLLTESALLATVGGVSGVCLAFALFQQFMHHGPPETELFNLSMDFRVLFQTAAITGLAGILTGVGPALLRTRDLHANPARMLPSDRTGQRWRHGLVVFEVSVTIALFILTAIMFDAYRRSLSSDQGFDRQPLVAALVEAPGGVKTLEICEHLRTLPGVVSAAAATAVPAAGRGTQHRFSTDAGGSQTSSAEEIFVTSNFFAVLGVPIRIGRAFLAQEERPGGSPVAIINETLARRLSPGKNPVGTQLWSSGRAYEVVGVVADYLWIPMARPSPAAYLPSSQQAEDPKHMQFVVRAASDDPAGLVQTARLEIRRLRADHVVSAFTMQSAVEGIAGEILTVVYPMFVLMGIGLFVSAAGIYAVLAFAIARRSREIAVRMAIGATRIHVLRLVGYLSLRLLALGLAFGTAPMFGLSRFAQGSGSLYDYRTPAVFVVPILVFLAVGALATWMPARRAIAINPAELLRIQ